jgi:hypothetical protein
MAMRATDSSQRAVQLPPQKTVASKLCEFVPRVKIEFRCGSTLALGILLRAVWSTDHGVSATALSGQSKGRSSLAAVVSRTYRSRSSVVPPQMVKPSGVRRLLSCRSRTTPITVGDRKCLPGRPNPEMSTSSGISSIDRMIEVARFI